MMNKKLIPLSMLITYLMLTNYSYAEEATDGTGSKNYVDWAEIGAGKDGNLKTNALAVGNEARAYADDTVALGANTLVSTDQGIAVGYNAKVSGGPGSVALGTNSSAQKSPEKITEAISNELIPFKGEVSIGNKAILRQITHLAGGTEDTDAVNVRQLRAVDNKINTIGEMTKQTPDGTIHIGDNSAGNAILITGKNGDRNVTGIADGIRDNDAVNLRQLRAVDNKTNTIGEMTKQTPDGTIHIGDNSAGNAILITGKNGDRNVTGIADGIRDNDATNVSQLNNIHRITAVTHELNDKNTLRLNELQYELSKTNKKVARGLASSAALTGLFQPYNVGKINVTAGFGRYDTTTAIAVGTGYRFNTHTAVKAGFAYSEGNNFIYNASFNLEW